MLQCTNQSKQSQKESQMYKKETVTSTRKQREGKFNERREREKGGSWISWRNKNKRQNVPELSESVGSRKKKKLNGSEGFEM